MKTQPMAKKSGFTLLETVIAIGVLAVLLTGFMYVFGPAATGIRKAINVQEADRLASTLEREMTTVRDRESSKYDNGFEKGYDWIESSYKPGEAIFVYQYRGDPADQRPDGTLKAMAKAQGSPGKDYVVQPMARRLNDPLFAEDIKAIEGGLFMVKCLQLTYTGSRDELEAKASSKGRITSPDGSGGGSVDNYPDAVIAFAAEFYSMPAKSMDYLKSTPFSKIFESDSNPIFRRNLAVRR
ncbi:type II secretion system protein [Luteolibacter sp. SL250]|uniref:type IV pilus modification PilV family protein n=1 Tax=Luteolibacter sp. SL250 TaxID=2995170 RepID=UPI00226EC433|nr:type II secretion system protein [Luteolibacter sp. SL250]WAC19223.1 type II secretion system protein [Luteolibacter sp. SL250]